MILRILAVGLQKVVVDVLHRHLSVCPVESDCLQFKHDQGSGRILRECLVNTEPDLGPGNHPARNQMGGDELLSDVVRHGKLPYLTAMRISGLLSGGSRYAEELFGSADQVLRYLGLSAVSVAAQEHGCSARDSAKV
jgi:hypothetical protein